MTTKTAHRTKSLAGNTCRKLGAMKQKGEALLAERRVNETVLDTWSASCAKYVEEVFGQDSEHIHQFKDPPFACFVAGERPDPRKKERERRSKLKERLLVLTQLIEQIDMEAALQSPPKMAGHADDAVWPLLHGKVIKAARTRFDAGHYADAVEAAFKELNTVVKEMVKKKTSQEFDGAPLMQKAFSPNPPVIIALDDLSIESGRNIQQGYMQIFAGAMIGIRNPKAHANLSITRERAVHLLFLASLLFHKLDERP